MLKEISKTLEVFENVPYNGKKLKIELITDMTSVYTEV